MARLLKTCSTRWNMQRYGIAHVTIRGDREFEKLRACPNHALRAGTLKGMELFMSPFMQIMGLGNETLFSG